MNELKAILIKHIEKYPLMQPQDMVKLIYQNEFGGGHMIRDAAQCLRRLEEEYADIAFDPTAELAEDIGGGMVRIHLAALDTRQMSLDALCDRFIRSAEQHRGEMPRFLEKTDMLLQMADTLGAAFGKEELTRYLQQYRAQGCPPVSHSDVFRRAYRPAYRIICKDLI